MHDNIKPFTNILFYYFPDELGLSETSKGKSQPIILIANLFLNLCFSQMSWSLTR